MYHLLVSYSGWAATEGTLGSGRVFGYTDDLLEEQFKPGGKLALESIYKFPAVFTSEVGGKGDQVARVGYIRRVSTVGSEIKIQYVFNPEIAPIPLTELSSLSSELEIGSRELHTTHWAIKDVDLFRVLHTKHIARGPAPKVFSFDDINRPESDLVSVMMPFSSPFTRVYEALKGLTADLNLRCLRADDLWEKEAVIDDVVSLICRSKIVICDCTGRNPNVFYEAGIAHSLGKDVILITQNGDDIPFDLRHLRYVRYLNNGEGLQKLAADLRSRIQQLAAV